MSEKKANILHLQNYLNISCGVSKTIYLIAKNTSSLFNLYVACFGGDGFSRFDSINIKPVVLKDHKNSILGFIKHLIKLFTYCKQNRINIIHSHHRYFDLLAFFISHILKIKTITSVQSKVYNYKLFSYKADILIACSKSIKTHLINEFNVDEKRINVIYNMVDPKEFALTKTKTELLNFLDIPSNKFVIGYFGRLNFEEKGIDVLLEAFLNISKLHKDLFLLLIGNGKDEYIINEFITQNKLKSRVINSRKDIFNYFQLLDLFVLPSRKDPFPLVMLEAGLMKKSLIGSNVDGISELIENEKDGLLFESANSIDLQNKILKIYRDKNYANQLAENLYSKVLNNYTVNGIIPHYNNLYFKILNEN
ncbi:glycosyltransferase family 4 protein [Stygiobacter electus]|uniref:Glycosyltransferase family 4 protein n=1 Tax=Stygiobacter electus TaxID=3032292 RepID=A0AAE3NZW7_9BACT|nr:glycosyltransferase family 4 protein [Stygiobacter electus]MDF1611499.1 glycosyltransferase family 4 protein [Stygiobacter electus]